MATRLPTAWRSRPADVSVEAGSWSVASTWSRNSDAQSASGLAAVQTCITASRREQLRPYAA
ncbi:MAG: hypothetical protein ACRDNS_15770, partial [Trebonia sp.]